MATYDQRRNSGVSILPVVGWGQAPLVQVLTARADLLNANSGNITSGDRINLISLTRGMHVLAVGCQALEASTSAVVFQVKIEGTVVLDETISASSVGNQDFATSSTSITAASGDIVNLSIATSALTCSGELGIWVQVVAPPQFTTRKQFSPSS